MSPEFQAALPPSIATFLVALLAFLTAVIASKKPSTPKVQETVSVGEGEEPFRGSPAEMLAMVWRDYNRVQAVAAAAQSDAAAARAEAKAANTAVVDMQEQYGSFVGAVRRYLKKIAAGWGQPGPFPAPDEGDFAVLEKALPKGHVSPTHSTEQDHS